MAILLRCTACRVRVSEAAATCPACGHPLTNDAEFQRRRAASNAPSSVSTILAAAVVIGLLVYAGGSAGESVGKQQQAALGALPNPTEKKRHRKPASAPPVVSDPILLPEGNNFGSLSEDKRAGLVEQAVRRTGERRILGGHGTDPFVATIQVVENELGGSEAGFQQVEFVHVTAGDITSGVMLYRVGFALGRACIVVRAGLNPNGRYEVAWEDWPASIKRAGSPPAKWLRFDE